MPVRTYCVEGGLNASGISQSARRTHILALKAPMKMISVQSSQQQNISILRTLCLASLGSALEFYDFIIFVFFTATIGNLFFPVSLPDWLRQVETFGIFAAGYLARPVGGIVLAHFGDTRGRKRMFTLSVLLMAIPTLLIGFLPTYRSIGVAAPVLLLVMRVMQGAAIGGEAPGAWVFAAEHAKPGQLGFAVGLVTSGLSCGILLGSLITSGVNLAFSQTQIAAVFWRIPFVIGGVFWICRYAAPSLVAGDTCL
jgi:MFS family permease